jgi:HJR/Mrr/RecB family endonuclease
LFEKHQELEVAEASEKNELQELEAEKTNAQLPEWASESALLALDAENSAQEAEDAENRNYVIAVVQRLFSLTSQHIVTLARKWDQTIYKDDYGNFIFDRWNRELDYFVDNVLRKDNLIASYLIDPMPELQAAHQVQVRKVVEERIQECKSVQSESNPHLSVDVDNLTPVEFEHYCADRLRNCGRDVRVTQASGDQGIDLIANRGNVKVVFQCKKYSQPVGNGAVQEIIAGKQFEQASIAAVVSNSTYTQSAKQLANTTGVHLLHFSELERFAEMVGVA